MHQLFLFAYSDGKVPSASMYYNYVLVLADIFVTESAKTGLICTKYTYSFYDKNLKSK